MMQLKPNIVLNCIRRWVVRMSNQRHTKTQQVDPPGGKCDNDNSMLILFSYLRSLCRKFRSLAPRRSLLTWGARPWSSAPWRILSVCRSLSFGVSMARLYQQNIIDSRSFKPRTKCFILLFRCLLT